MQEVNPNPCRFCGHAAEADHRQGYCMYPSGKMDHQAAIYCTSCNATMTLCRADTPEMDDDERMATLLEQWNRSDARNQAIEEAASYLSSLSTAYYERCDSRRTDNFAEIMEGEKEDAVTGHCFAQAAAAIRALKEKTE